LSTWTPTNAAVLNAIRQKGPFPSRVGVREQVLCCERCALYKTCRSPVPFVGPSPAFIAVLGEAPGHNEDVKGKPWCGPAGMLLNRELKKVGVDPEQAFLLNAVSCFPHEGNRARRPSDDELKACAPNRYAQLALARPRYLLVLGGTALYSLRPDLKISKSRGRPFCLLPNEPEGTIVFPSYHPSAALRNGNFLKAFQEDLATFVEMTQGSWVDHLPTNCSTCGVEADPWFCDAVGIVYCSTHRFGHSRQEWLRDDLREMREEDEPKTTGDR
jgi:uracil-DNA glycosylase family 4